MTMPAIPQTNRTALHFNDVHKSNRPSALKRSEDDVASVVSAVKHFLNPFRIEGINQQQLFCLSSGQPATTAVAADLLRYVDVGKDAAELFVNTRLISKTVQFHQPIKKQNLLTFKTMATNCKLTTTQQKSVQVRAERNLFGRLLLLCQSNDISLEKLFTYQLGPIPWSMATGDGSLVKTDKAQLMHCLEETVADCENTAPVDRMYIIDGNAHIQSMTHLPATFEELAHAVFCTLPKASVVHFVTDTYWDNSIKQLERSQRGSASAYMIGGGKTKLPRDFKSFLLNDENKQRLIKLMLNEWQSEKYAARLRGHQVLYVCEDECVQLQSEDGITVTACSVPALYSNQEKADTRIILHCLHAAATMPTDTGIIVRSPDTDVLVLLLAYSCEVRHQLFFDTGTGNNRRLIDVHRIGNSIGTEMAKALSAFHAFTGSDCTSAFVRRGKRGPLKLLQKNPQFLTTFHQIGTYPDRLADDVLEDLQRFV